MFQIHKDIPVPMKTRDRYPFHEMAVGSCFFFDEDDAKRVAGSASRYGRLNGKRFAVRKHGSRFGCWRLEDGPPRTRKKKASVEAAGEAAGE